MQKTIVGNSDGNLHSVEKPRSDSRACMGILLHDRENVSSSPWNSSMRRSSAINTNDAEEKRVKSPTSLEKKPKNRKKKTKKMTVIVEDASDSDYDNNYCKNNPLWRNCRRNGHPLPGQWMESIEIFQ
jgi:hypothetical protein